VEELQTQASKPPKKCPECQKTFSGEHSVCPEDGRDLAPLQPEADPRVGTIFADKYEILSVLGQGGMSIVYKARHKYMQRIVAVKVLLKHLISDETAFKRFEQESRAASALSHQNIVSVHDFGQTQEGEAYFVMDCLEGDSLEDVIYRWGRVEPARAVDIFRQVCEGLAHAHKKGVIHRDLKPSNIVLIREDDGTETAKIVDFGIAKMADSQDGKPMRLTQTGQVFGSPLYMSPEQCQGHVLDARSDIYSLGCLMYETLSGMPPFSADSFFNMALHHLQTAPPSLADTAPDAGIAKPLEDVVLKCLAKSPDDRFETADQLRQKLLDAALLSGIPGLKPGAVPSHPGRTTGGSPLRKTWEAMKAVVDAQGRKQKKKISPVRIGVLFVVGLALTACATFFFTWPGTEGDRGTPFMKTVWQIQMNRADAALASGDYKQANQLLLEAKKIATNDFSDGQLRLRLVVERQIELYHRMGDWSAVDAASKEQQNIVRAQVLTGYDATMEDVGELTDNINDPIAKAEHQAHAHAAIGRVLAYCKRLELANFVAQEQKLLDRLKDAFTRLGLTQTEDMAQVETALAECLAKEQRFPEAGNLLRHAAAIRDQARKDNPSKDSLERFLRAQLKLGQFDRDQSNFAAAKQELHSALALAESDFKGNKVLLSEAVLSCRDLARQMNEAAEYEKMNARFDEIKHNK
jgi:serine/threonine-protein kinase